MTISKLILFVLVVIFTNSLACAEQDTHQSNDSAPLTISDLNVVNGITLAPQRTNGERQKIIQSLNLTGLDGVQHSLNEWKGKVIVINFWATWCSPCLVEIRDFISYQEKYSTRGLQMIGVGLDEAKKLRNVQRTLEINYPVLVADPVEVRGLMEKWGNDTGVVPYTVVLGRNGKVSYAHRGVMNKDIFTEYVLPLLEKKEGLN